MEESLSVQDRYRGALLGLAAGSSLPLDNGLTIPLSPCAWPRA